MNYLLCLLNCSKEMKTIIPIVIALSILQVALGIELVCHLATLGDPVWAESKCCCSPVCDNDGNGTWYTTKEEYILEENCGDQKTTKCECTERTTARFGFGADPMVLTWEPEADEGIGSFNLEDGQ